MSKKINANATRFHELSGELMREMNKPRHHQHRFKTLLKQCEEEYSNRKDWYEFDEEFAEKFLAEMRAYKK